jgi:Spy/CpxP family protein refolding chaperone
MKRNGILLAGKAKILKLSLVAALATTTIYSFGGPGCDTMNSPMYYGSYSHFQNDSMRNIMMNLSNMELSSTQWKKIREVMFDMREQRFENFRKKEDVVMIDKNGTFNKEEFIKNRTALSKEMIESQSKVVERILSILDDTQKKQLVSKLY